MAGTGHTMKSVATDLHKRVVGFARHQFHQDWRLVRHIDVNAGLFYVARFTGEVEVENISENLVLLDLVLWFDAFERGALYMHKERTVLINMIASMR